MILMLIIGLLSVIPFIDKFITENIYNIRFTNKFSRLFSLYIIYINITINLMLIFYTKSYKKIFIRYFIELIVVNLLFKRILDRKRPYKSLLIGEYNPIYKIRVTNKYNDFGNQSFPSGHVCSIYTTHNLIKDCNFIFLEKIYHFLIYLTSYARMNTGAHHFSDCVFAVIITDVSNFILNKVITYLLTYLLF